MTEAAEAEHGAPASGVNASELCVSSRERCVFINCPFDKDYETLFDATIFATVISGYWPRSALETGQVSEPRIQKILRAIRGSKYSIHDLSRCKGGGDENLARFNMPLELGIAMAERFAGGTSDNWHDWLAIVPEGHVYGRFISDLAGYDPKCVEDKVEHIVPAVMSWLSTREDAVDCPTPDKVLKLLPEFIGARKELKWKWGGHESWPSIIREAILVGKRGKLIKL